MRITSTENFIDYLNGIKKKYARTDAACLIALTDIDLIDFPRVARGVEKDNFPFAELLLVGCLATISSMWLEYCPRRDEPVRSGYSRSPNAGIRLTPAARIFTIAHPDLAAPTDARNDAEDMRDAGVLFIGTKGHVAVQKRCFLRGRNELGLTHAWSQ